MNFAEKLKTKRKEFGISQEQLAEKIGVSRQAITKWETDGGMPDIENILSIASIFNVTVDELLSSERQIKNSGGFFHESTVEYDIDSIKHYDMNIGGAHKIAIDSHNGEKLCVRLASNAIASLEHLFKVKIDDGKNNVDVDINRGGELSEAQAKEALSVFISVPAKYIAGIELNARTDILRLTGIEAEAIEFDGKVNRVYVSGVKGFVELSASTDMTVVCDSLSGGIGINQISATSTIHLPKGTEYQVRKKGAANRISYTLDGKESAAPSYPDTQNIIKLSGMNMELVVNECTDIAKEVR